MSTTSDFSFVIAAILADILVGVTAILSCCLTGEDLAGWATLSCCLTGEDLAGRATLSCCLTGEDLAALAGLLPLDLLRLRLLLLVLVLFKLLLLDLFFPLDLEDDLALVLSCKHNSMQNQFKPYNCVFLQEKLSSKVYFDHIYPKYWDSLTHC